MVSVSSSAISIVALEVAEPVAQRISRSCPCAATRRSRIGGRPISAQRVLVAAEAFGQPAGQHRDRRLELARHADRLEFVAAGRRRRRNRRTSIEARSMSRLSARAAVRSAASPIATSTLRKPSRASRPLALPRIGQRAPERRVVLVADSGLAQILERRVGAAEHDIGDRRSTMRGRRPRRSALVGERDVEHALGLGIHVAREIEAREIERALRGAWPPARSAAARDQLACRAR